MSLPRSRLIVLLVLALGGAGALWFFFGRTRPVTAQDLQGEWVQDPEFLQNAGADLDAQKRELEHFENYQFAFQGARLTGWCLVFDDGQRDGTGWAQGKGVSFVSDFALAPGKGATLLKFTDHTKAAREAQLAWERDKLNVSLGERKLRLMKKTADQLRARNLIAAP
jgi:hypothetical protein